MEDAGETQPLNMSPSRGPGGALALEVTGMGARRRDSSALSKHLWLRRVGVIIGSCIACYLAFSSSGSEVALLGSKAPQDQRDLQASSYFVEIRLEIPDAGLSEPLRVWSDEALGLQRVEYWHGANQFYLNKSGPGCQSLPVSLDGVHGEIALRRIPAWELARFVPDVRGFDSTGLVKTIRGVQCDEYRLEQKTFDSVTGMIGEYTYWVDQLTGHPVRFSFLGKNSLTNSHFDNYTFDYLSVNLDPLDPAVFRAPEECGKKPFLVFGDDEKDDDGSLPVLDLPRTQALQGLAEVTMMMPGEEAAALRRQAWDNFQASLPEDDGASSPVGPGARWNWRDSQRWAGIWSARGEHQRTYSVAAMGPLALTGPIERAKRAQGKARGQEVAVAVAHRTARVGGLTQEFSFEALRALAKPALDERASLSESQQAQVQAEEEVDAEQAHKQAAEYDAKAVERQAKSQTYIEAVAASEVLAAVRQQYLGKGRGVWFGDLSRDGLPKWVDWRKAGAVLPVQDQGTCGSCWTYGSAAAAEGQYFRRSGGRTVKLSEQAMVDCSWPFGNQGCDGGDSLLALFWSMSVGGMPSTDRYGPFRNADGICHFNETQAPLAVRGVMQLRPSADALRFALATLGPVSVAIDATPNSFYFYSGGIYNAPPTECKADPSKADHVVTIVGYGSGGDKKADGGGDYWILRNSWSKFWGEEGYMRIASSENTCGVTNDMVIPVVDIVY